MSERALDKPLDPVALVRENKALRESLMRAYELSYRYWNEEAGRDYSGDEAKELRRAIWDQCLKPHGIEHPKGWA